MGGLILLRFPAASLTLLLASVVLIESKDAGLIPAVPQFYDPIGGGVTAFDLFLICGLLGVVIRARIDESRPEMPRPFLLPLALLGAAVLCGLITAHYAHAEANTKELFHRASYPLYMMLVPILTVNVLRTTESLRSFAVVAAALAAFKGISGTYAALGGKGELVEGQTVSYLSPLSNLLMLVYVLGVAAALVRKIRLPTWMLVTAPLAVLALALSYRRSFWIAAIFALLTVVIIASRRRGRAVFAIAAVAVVIAIVASFSVGGSGSSSSPIVERAQSLSPTGTDSNRGDRYRTDERHNVVANLEEHPLTGIGLGVPWVIHYPTAEVLDRRYTHIAVLSYWLNFGILGAIAYIALMASALWASIGVWRRHPDAVVKVGAVACFGAILALVVVELTATFAGVDPRVSILVGAGLGWLAAAWRQLPERPDQTPMRAIT